MNKWIAILVVLSVLINAMVVDAKSSSRDGSDKNKKSGSGDGSDKKKSGSDDGSDKSKDHHRKGSHSGGDHGRDHPRNITCGWIDGEKRYDFSEMSHRTISFVDDSNEVYLSFCGRSSNDSSIPAGCDPKTNACVKIDGRYHDGGNKANWTSMEDGVTIEFKEGEQCESDKSIERSTTVHISCNRHQKEFLVKSVSSIGCSTVIEAESNMACDMEDGSGEGKHKGRHGKDKKKKIVIIASSVGGGIGFIAIVAGIAIAIRRRRQRLNAKRSEEEQMRFLQPMQIQQPMVPAHWEMMQPVQGSDAELARRLQEQFNRGM